MGEKLAFDSNNYLDSPTYEKMGGWKLTSEQVIQIADARMKRKAGLDAKEAESRADDTASADSGLRALWIPSKALPRMDSSIMTWGMTVDIPTISMSDLPLPTINTLATKIEDRKWGFPDAATILAIQDPNRLESVFRDIIAKIKPDWKFSFNNIDDATFQAIKAVYWNWKIRTRSASGSEYAHWLANSIILSGEIGSNKSLITNHFDLQEGYRVAIQQATSPVELRARLTELNDWWGKVREYWRVEWERKANNLANTWITPDNRKIIEWAWYKIIQEWETIMITWEKKWNVSINYVLSPDYPISDVKIEWRSLVITYLQGMKPQILPIQWEGRSIQVQSWNENLATLDARTDELSRAVNWLNASVWLVYNRLWTRLFEWDSWKELMQKFLTDSRFTPIRESIANDIIARAKILTGWFLWFWKKPSFPDIADKGKGDVVLKGVWSYPKIESGMEFEVAGKTYVIWNSRDRTEWVVLLSKEQASKNNDQPVRFT